MVISNRPVDNEIMATGYFAEGVSDPFSLRNAAISTPIAFVAFVVLLASYPTGVGVAWISASAINVLVFATLVIAGTIRTR